MTAKCCGYFSQAISKKVLSSSTPSEFGCSNVYVRCPLVESVLDVRARIDGEAEVRLHLLRDDAEDGDPVVDRRRRIRAGVDARFP
jgi:hypothetical protein